MTRGNRRFIPHHAHAQLTTENNRYKRQLYDLQQRLADIEAGRPTKKGEASSMLALRARVRVAIRGESVYNDGMMR